MRRLARALAKLALATVIFGVVSATAVVVQRHLENARSELSPAEWVRLKERWFGLAGQAPGTGATLEVSELTGEDRRQISARLEQPPLDADVAARQSSEYAARRPKSVIELNSNSARRRRFRRAGAKAAKGRPRSST